MYFSKYFTVLALMVVQGTHGCQDVDYLGCYRGNKAQIYRYWSPLGTDHLYTAGNSEIGNGGNGYNYESIEGQIFTTQIAGTVPLYRLWNGVLSDHLYTAAPAELNSSGKLGWSLEFITGYVDPAPNMRWGTIPLYRYWSPILTDHFYTTNYNEQKEGTTSGYYKESIVGYVCPADAGDISSGLGHFTCSYSAV